MQITVISPERAVYDGEATSVVAPAFDGKVGILPHHAPFMTLLGEGTLAVRVGSTSRFFHVREGFLQVQGDVIRVVTRYAEEEQGGAHA